jgi:nucleoid-associated protein YgaU
MRRYARTPVLNYNQMFGTAEATTEIRRGVANNSISFEVRTSVEGDRLDILAGIYYGNGSLWWVIAAASNIGWGLQVPPGTLLRIPSVADIGELVA